jgi:serine/threonine-protein kinase
MFDDAQDDRGVLAVGTMVGMYRIERAIAEGGMATVYEGAHCILPRRAAIKVLHRHLLGKWGARERLFQEARILDSLDHPGLVRLHDAGILDDNRPWLAMELLEGATLAQLISVHRQLETVEVCDLLGKVAVALDAAHSAGIVHRDLKPENIIIVRKDGELRSKIVDWGIARIDCDPSTRITRADMTPGTPLYMSPEQARGKTLDGKSDVYALGVIAFEALTGRLPFEGESPLDIVIQHLTAEPPLVRDRRADVPVALETLIATMLRKEPENRPTLAEVEVALLAIREGRAADVEIDVDVDDEEITMEIEIEMEADAPLLSMRWTPEAPCYAIVKSDEQPFVSGEIVDLPRRRSGQSGKADVLGLAFTAMVTALMLAAAIALPVIGQILPT